MSRKKRRQHSPTPANATPQASPVPATPAVPVAAGVTAPNAVASARTLEELAFAASSAGEFAAQDMLLKLHAQAQGSAGGRVAFNMPMMGQPARDISGQRTPYDLDRQEIVKGMVKESFHPRKTPYKISASLLQLGAYDGIRDPAVATQHTMRYQRQMARNPYVTGIRRTRRNQVMRYAKAAQHPKDMGFKIMLRDERAPMTRGARKQMQLIEDIVLHGGLSHLPGGGERLTNTETGEPGVWDGFMQEKALPLRESLPKEVDDLLVLDWSCLRIEEGGNNDKFPIVFVSPVDSAQIRRTEPYYYGPARVPGNESMKRVTFVEVSPDNEREVCREYDWHNMSVLMMDQQLDFWSRGYGRPPLEDALETIIALDSSFNFQKDYYSDSHLPYGILQFLGMPAMSSRQFMDAWRTEWYRNGGKGNFWNVMTAFFPMGPNGQSGKLEFEPFRSVAGPEMAAAMQWDSAVRNILFMLFAIDPQELGFESFTMKTQTMQENDPTAVLQHSQQRGWVPLMEALVGRRNHDIVWRIDEDFVMRWVNLEPQNEVESEQVAQQKFMRGWTPNMLQASNDEEPIKIPLDPPLYNQIAAKYDETEFDTHDEFKAKVEKLYEAQCKKLGYVKAWSAAPDLPAGSPTMMQIIEMEMGQNQQATMPQQGVGPDGQPLDPNAQQGAMPGQPGHPVGPAAQGAQDAQQPGQDPNADLQPHHLLADNQQPPEDPQDEDDNARRDRYKRGIIERLMQQQQAGPGLKKALRGIYDDLYSPIVKAMNEPLPPLPPAISLIEPEADARTIVVHIR